MENSKLANRNGNGAQIGRSASSAQQDQVSAVTSAGEKAVRKKTATRKLTLRHYYERRWVASRSRASWSVAIAAAETLLQVLSSGVTADAGNVSASAMARPHGRERRRAGSSSESREQGLKLERVRSLLLFRHFEHGQMRGTEVPSHHPVRR